LPVRSVERVAIRRGALSVAKVGSRCLHLPSRPSQSRTQGRNVLASAPPDGQRRSFQASQVADEGNPSPVAASAQRRYAGAQIRRDQPDPCAVPVSFQCHAERGRAGEDAKEPLVRGRRAVKGVHALGMHSCHAASGRSARGEYPRPSSHKTCAEGAPIKNLTRTASWR
jgi:hypothetical protein